ncbi:MAG: PilZ domain-containing protein [Acidobacteriota bacterium]
MGNRPNLRKHERKASGIKVEMGWIEGNGNPKSALCECKNVGAGGFRIFSRDPIPAGAYVQFRFAPVNFRGSASVRHVNHVAIGYEIGLEFSGSEQMEVERRNLLASSPLVKQVQP